MNDLIFAICKQEHWTVGKKWVIESLSQSGSKIDRKEHGSRKQGIISLFSRHAGSDMFHLIIPSSSGNVLEKDYIVIKNPHTRKWVCNDREYTSRIKATTDLLRRFHPNLSAFTIVIPINKEVSAGSNAAKAKS